MGKMPKKWHWQDRPENSLQAVGVEDVFVEGKRSLRIDGGKKQDPGGRTLFSIVASAEIPLPPGKSYRLTARIKADKPDVKVALAGQSYIAHVYFWAKDAGFTVGTNWQTCQMVFKTPEPGDAGYHSQMKDFCARVDFRESSGQIWVDDVDAKRGRDAQRLGFLESARLRSAVAGGRSTVRRARARRLSPAGDFARLPTRF